MNGAASAIGHHEVGRDTRRETATERLNLAEAPHAAVGDDRLADLSCKGREVEIVAAQHRFRNGNAHVGTARALRLHLEAVDARQITLAHPQRICGMLRVTPCAIEGDGVIVIEHRGGGGGDGGRQRGGADDPQEVASFHGADTTRARGQCQMRTNDGIERSGR